MMILYHLKNTILPAVRKVCDNCCPEYKERDADCHQSTQVESRRVKSETGAGKNTVISRAL